MTYEKLIAYDCYLVHLSIIHFCTHPATIHRKVITKQMSFSNLQMLFT